MDTRAINNRPYLADPLPDYPGDVCIRLRASRQEETALAGRPTLCHQPGRKPDIHSHSIRHAELVTGSARYSGRLGDHYLDDTRDLEAL